MGTQGLPGLSGNKGEKVSGTSLAGVILLYCCI